MNQQWRIRITGKPKKQPDIALLVRAVLALGEQLQEADAKGTVPDGPEANEPQQEAG
jgi:hypothetical protein